MVILFVSFMTNSTFIPTCVDNGYGNEYVYVCMYSCNYARLCF